MESATEKCPLCEKSAAIKEEFEWFDVNCDRCGEFAFTEEFWMFEIRHHRISGEERAMLSGHVREQNLIDKRPRVTTENYASMLELAPVRIADKAMKFLAAVERQSKWFGQGIAVRPEVDYPLGYAINAEELVSFIRYAEQSGFISSWTETDTPVIRLEAKGFQEVENRRRANVESEKAFVAMPFCPEMNKHYHEQIKPGIERAGYRSVRVDQEHYNTDVIDRMLAEIRESRFVVADFTDHRNGVYFEAGFAMGLSLPVIFMCRKDDMESAHFDTNHFNHIQWEPTDTTVAERLEARIVATIGRGPLKPRK